MHRQAVRSDGMSSSFSYVGGDRQRLSTKRIIVLRFYGGGIASVGRRRTLHGICRRVVHRDADDVCERRVFRIRR